MATIFLDANILLEVLLDRQKTDQCRRQLAQDDSRYFIAAVTVHIVWYMAEKYHLNRQAVDQFLAGFITIPINTVTLDLAAQRYDGKDFEDCLQAACAELGKCHEIITLDKHFAAHSGTKLPVRVL